ncbi:MAG: hypothetical protein LBC72_01705 [Spirochaetaceae bacterium]|jgi:hypothetical protein|nr:hypothetical protein [Spirochaetaceae bacterium]
MEHKKTILVLVCVFLLGLAIPARKAAAQTLLVQPYITLDYDPVYFDPFAGETGLNARALNFNQAGIKFTGTVSTVTAFIEARGYPGYSAAGGGNYEPGSTPFYNHADPEPKWFSPSPVYYAWAKWQATETGNLWAGKFKPFFGPALFDQSHYGIGWQQKISGVTVNVFAMQPRRWDSNLFTVSGMPAEPVHYWEGLRILASAERFKAGGLTVAGGALFDWLPNGEKDAYRLTGDVYVSYTGIKNLTLIGEAACIVNIYEDGIKIKSTEAPESAAVGLGVYINAEYKPLSPLACGLTFTLKDACLGADKNAPYDGLSSYSGFVAQKVDGEINTATVGIYGKYAPHKSFYIQPQVNIKFANALNGYTPPDGKQAGVDFQIRFRWEPSFVIKQDAQ